jgi:hypothetical protein
LFRTIAHPGGTKPPLPPIVVSNTSYGCTKDQNRRPGPGDRRAGRGNPAVPADCPRRAGRAGRAGQRRRRPRRSPPRTAPSLRSHRLWSRIHRMDVQKTKIAGPGSRRRPPPRGAKSGPATPKTRLRQRIQTTPQGPWRSPTAAALVRPRRPARDHYPAKEPRRTPDGGRRTADGPTVRRSDGPVQLW